MDNTDKKQEAQEAIDALRTALDTIATEAVPPKTDGETPAQKCERRNRAASYRRALKLLGDVEAHFLAMSKGF